MPENSNKGDNINRRPKAPGAPPAHARKMSDVGPISPKTVGKAMYDVFENMQCKSLSESMWSPRNTDGKIKTGRSSPSSMSASTLKTPRAIRLRSPTLDNATQIRVSTAATQTELTMIELATLLDAKDTVGPTMNTQSLCPSPSQSTTPAPVPKRVPPHRRASKTDQSIIKPVNIPLGPHTHGATSIFVEKQAEICGGDSDVGLASRSRYVPPHMRAGKRGKDDMDNFVASKSTIEDSRPIDSPLGTDLSLETSSRSSSPVPDAEERRGRSSISKRVTFNLDEGPESLPPETSSNATTAAVGIPVHDPVAQVNQVNSEAKTSIRKCPQGGTRISEEGEIQDTDNQATYSPLDQPTGSIDQKASSASQPASILKRRTFDPLAYGGLTRMTEKIPDRSEQVRFQSWGPQLPRAGQRKSRLASDCDCSR